MYDTTEVTRCKKLMSMSLATTLTHKRSIQAHLFSNVSPETGDVSCLTWPHFAIPSPAPAPFHHFEIKISHDYGTNETNCFPQKNVTAEIMSLPGNSASELKIPVVNSTAATHTRASKRPKVKHRVAG